MIYHGFRRIALAHSLLPSTPDHTSPSWPGVTRPSIAMDTHGDPHPDDGEELDAEPAHEASTHIA
jgi:hypothetical protein